MRGCSLTVAILGLALGWGVASGRVDAQPGSEPTPGRFVLQPTEGGVVRLDTATGDVSLCAHEQGTFACRPVADDRDLQSELARLSEENRQLRSEVERLEGQMQGDAAPARPAPRFELPSEEDVDKALGYLERMFKRFRDKLRELDGQTERKSDGTPL